MDWNRNLDLRDENVWTCRTWSSTRERVVVATRARRDPRRPLEPVDTLSDDVQRELDRWDLEGVAEYYERRGGEAPPDAPHIDPDRT